MQRQRLGLFATRAFTANAESPWVEDKHKLYGRSRGHTQLLVLSADYGFQDGQMHTCPEIMSVVFSVSAAVPAPQQ